MIAEKAEQGDGGVFVDVRDQRPAPDQVEPPRCREQRKILPCAYRLNRKLSDTKLHGRGIEFCPTDAGLGKLQLEKSENSPVSNGEIEDAHNPAGSDAGTFKSCFNASDRRNRSEEHTSEL